jgi:hypothetical protein
MTTELTRLQIKALIDKHDPALLFALGAPEDEYVGEAQLVHELLDQNWNLNKEEIAEGLKKIFASRFTPRTVEINPNAYDNLAADIVGLLSMKQ